MRLYSMHGLWHGPLPTGLGCICMRCMHVCGSTAHKLGGHCKDCLQRWRLKLFSFLTRLSSPIAAALLLFPCTLRNAVQMPSRAVASAAVVLMGLVWASVGLALLVATEYLESPAAKCAWCPCACHQVHAPKMATQER